MQRALILVLAASAQFGCQDKAASVKTPSNMDQIEQKANTMTQNVSIKLGELGPDFQNRYPSQVRINKQPAGLDFYRIRWDSSAQGNVNVEHGKNSFQINNVLSMQTSIDIDAPLQGFTDISVNAGITAPDLIPHDQARLKTYDLLKKIEQNGWRVVTPRSRPRLIGQERLNYALNVSNSIGLDVQYLPTLNEWMQIENLTDWQFYADGQYLTIHFKRERTLLDPTKPGSYLLTFTLTSETEQFRGYVESEDRLRWKTLLPSQLDKLKPVRAKAEAALKAQAIKIDETYQDPPLPNLK